MTSASLEYNLGQGDVTDVCDELEQLGCEVGGQTGLLPETNDGQPIKICEGAASQQQTISVTLFPLSPAAITTLRINKKSF